MPQLALGLVGAGIGSAIGGTFLGVTATGWGWALGSMLGARLGQKNQSIEGPRLGDLSVQASTYGTMKPIIYGSMRVAGNVIYCTDKREVSNSQTEGGKGGPKVTTTTYSYNVDIAIALCEGPIAGIRKVWRNGELIYDASAGADVGTILASTLHAEAFRVYLGDEAQLPDPTIEAEIGVGLTPAYRGTAYVVFDHMDCPNGVIPQLTFEVVTAATDDGETVVYAEAPTPGAFGTFGVVGRDQTYHVVMTSSTVGDVYLVGPDYAEFDRVVDFSTDDGVHLQLIPTQGGPFALKGSYHDDDTYTIDAFDLRTGVMTQAISVADTAALEAHRAAFDEVSERFCAIGSAGTDILIMPGGQEISVPTAGVPMAFYDDVVSCCANHDGETWLQKYDADTTSLISEVGAGASLSPTVLRVHADATGTYVLDSSVSGGPRSLWKVTDDEWILLTSDAEVENSSGTISTFYSDDSFAIVGPTGAPVYRLVRYDSLTADTVPLPDVIEDICVRAGLESSQVDTTGIEDEVNGYQLSQVASGRANNEPLTMAFAIDVTESDAKLKFRKRATQEVVASIDFDDLGAVEAGSDAEDPFPLTRAQEADLPRSVALTYINMDADYQPGTETARRQVTLSINDVATNIPIATYPNHMAQVSAVSLYDAWQARNQWRLKLQRKFAYLDVGDNITVEHPRDTYSTKRITRMIDTGLLLELEVTDSHPAIYDITAPGASPPKAQDGVAYAYPTKWLPLDMPILRDADDDHGFYVPARSVVEASWPGAVFYKEGNSGFESVTQITTESVMGVTLTALDDWTGPDVVDELSTVQVNVGHGELSSSTRDAILDGTTNAILVGSEVLQFHTATEDSPGVYTLAGFLRGRRGTEWAQTGHEVGERFVLLTTAMRRIELQSSEVDETIAYKAVTIGATLDATSQKDHANEAIGKKPFAPVYLRENVVSGERSFTWERRSRLAMNLLTGTVPLGEETESYDVELLDGDDVVFSTTVTEREATVSSLLESFTLAAATTRIGESSSIGVGAYDTYPAETNVASLRLFTPLTGTDDESKFIGGLITGLAISGSAIYVANYDGGEAESFVRRFDVGDIQTVLATYTATQVSGLVYHGSYVWTNEASGDLLKLNPTTLALEDTFTDPGLVIATSPGYLWLSTGTSIIKWDIATEAGVLTISASVSSVNSTPPPAVVVGSLLFVGSNSGISVFNTSTGALVTSIVDGASFDAYRSVAVFGSEVVFNSLSASQLIFFSSTTGLITRRADVDGHLLRIAGVIDDLIYLTRRVGYTGIETVAFESRDDLSGLVLRVYQNSATVGRGYPAELEL
jgi:hypothetical protein